MGSRIDYLTAEVLFDEFYGELADRHPNARFSLFSTMGSSGGHMGFDDAGHFPKIGAWAGWLKRIPHVGDTIPAKSLAFSANALCHEEAHLLKFEEGFAGCDPFVRHMALSALFDMYCEEFRRLGYADDPFELECHADGIEKSLSVFDGWRKDLGISADDARDAYYGAVTDDHPFFSGKHYFSIEDAVFDLRKEARRDPTMMDPVPIREVAGVPLSDMARRFLSPGRWKEGLAKCGTRAEQLDLFVEYAKAYPIRQIGMFKCLAGDFEGVDYGSAKWLPGSGRMEARMRALPDVPVVDEECGGEALEL